MAAVEQILSYLTAKGLIGKEMYWAQLTPHGIDDIEKALEHPDIPAAPYLPAIDVINAQTIHLASGAQLMQVPVHCNRHRKAASVSPNCAMRS